MWLLFACLALTGLGFYYGFVHSARRVRLQGMFLVGLLLTGVATYSLSKEWQAERYLASLITPVPDVTGFSIPPTAPSMQPSHFLVKTSRSPSWVRDFYLNAANRPGWEVADGTGPAMRLRRPDAELTIFITEGWGTTNVTYRLAPKATRRVRDLRSGICDRTAWSRSVSKPLPRVAADGPGPQRAFFARWGGAAPRQPGGASHVRVLLAPRTGGTGRGQNPQMRF